ncbi:MAG: hypothetical protein ACD_19C00176G0053 [uncultured bacterium]|nr:MAG: hypothetical protein ACD_19C00176G0053 [uncultured bacterium]HBY01670.1 hypothetical protein [Rikenellaceae bacterium]
MKIRYTKKGFSLIEMMITISIFAVIGVLVTSSMALTLRSSKKSDSLVRVRESLNYSLSSLERQIRNSEKITSTCAITGTTSTSISYISIEGITTQFECKTPGALGYIASGSASLRLTPSDISITSCSFTCTQAVNSPAIIKVNVTAEDNTSTSTEKGSVSTTMEIITRNY